MKFIIIRNDKADTFSMHASTCRVAMKHYDGKRHCSMDTAVAAEGYDSVAECLAGIATYAEECGWNAAPDVKICGYAKV